MSCAKGPDGPGSTPGSRASAVSSTTRTACRSTCSWVRSLRPSGVSASRRALALRSSSASSAAPRRAASTHQPCCRPRTCSASLGVKPATVASPRSTRRRRAATPGAVRATLSTPRGSAPSASKMRCSRRSSAGPGPAAGLRTAKWPAPAGSEAAAARRASSVRTAGNCSANRLSGTTRRGPTLRRRSRSKRHLAVAAEAAGVDVDRLHHGAPAADHRAFGPHHRASVRHHRDIGRGAAHVRDHEVPQTAEEARPDHARRRSRQHRLDRILERHRGLHQRAVAAHDHQRRRDALAAEHFLHRIEQVAHLRRQACVQGRGQRAPRRIELRAQLVTAGHRLAAPARGCARARAARGRDCAPRTWRPRRTPPRCHRTRATAACTAASSSGSASSPDASWPPRTHTMLPPPPRLRPERSTMRSSKPTSSVQIGLKRLSTTALVASVVEAATSAICSRRTPAGSADSRAWIASLMPRARSQWVVRALALPARGARHRAPPHRCRCRRYPGRGVFRAARRQPRRHGRHSWCCFPDLAGTPDAAGSRRRQHTEGCAWSRRSSRRRRAAVRPSRPSGNSQCRVSKNQVLMRDSCRRSNHGAQPPARNEGRLRAHIGAPLQLTHTCEPRLTPTGVPHASDRPARSHGPGAGRSCVELRRRARHAPGPGRRGGHRRFHRQRGSLAGGPRP